MVLETIRTQCFWANNNLRQYTYIANFKNCKFIKRDL